MNTPFGCQLLDAIYDFMTFLNPAMGDSLFLFLSRPFVFFWLFLLGDY